MLQACISMIIFAAIQPINIVVTAKTNSGFVDSGRMQDSLRDLREAIAKIPGLTIVENERDSKIVLELTQAGNVIVAPTQETKIRRGIFGGVDSTTRTKQEELPSLTVMMKVRGTDYQKEFSITRQMFWKDLAKNIARQFDDWLKVNRSNLK